MEKADTVSTHILPLEDASDSTEPVKISFQQLRRALLLEESPIESYEPFSRGRPVITGPAHALVPHESSLIRSAWLRHVLAQKRSGEGTASSATSSTRDPHLQLQPAFARLDRFSSLEANWDSYDAQPISRRAISLARDLLDSVSDSYGVIAAERILPYLVAPLADGGVQVEWRGSRGDLEVEIGSAGDLSFLLITGSAENRRFEEEHNVPWGKILTLIGRVLIG